MADDVQSAEDQGAASTDSGSDLYDLGSVDPEIREQLTPHLKAIEGNVTKKFQEASEYRKGWEPYEELGLRDMNPEAVKQLLDFAQLAQNPEQFDQWLKNAAKERGLLTEEPEIELDDDLDQEAIDKLVEEKLKERLSPIEQTFQQQQEETKVAQANEEIGGALKKIEGDYPALFEGKSDEEKKAVENAIIQLAFAYTQDDSLTPAQTVEKGFEDYKSLVGQGEKSLFEQKANQPDPAEGPGAASTAADKVTSFDDPRWEQIAKERLRKAS